MACSKCRDTGVIELEGKLHECICAYLRRRAAEMPTYIRKAPVTIAHIKLDIISGVDKSYYVVASWADLKAAVKIMMIKYPNKFIKITSDREIRDVYVGATSRSAKGYPDETTEGEIFNTLQDLMDLPDLVIVRLNEMYYKNKAAPGALEEAISYRTDRDKPTWVFSDVSKPFVTGCHAWSDTVNELLQTAFVKIAIPRIHSENSGAHSPTGVLAGNLEPVTSGVSRPGPVPPVLSQISKPVSAPQSPRKPAEEPGRPIPRKIQSVPDSDDPLSIYGSGLGESKKFHKID